MKRLLIISLFVLGGLFAQAQVPTDTTSLRSMINSVLVANGSKQITAKQMNEILNGIVSLMKAHAVDDAYKSGDTIYLTRSGGYPAIKLYVPGSGSISESDPTVPTAAKLLTTTDVSRWNNKQDKLTEGTGVDITANVITANNALAIWNAEKIQGRLIDPTIPTVGQVLKWNGTAWIPQDDLGGSGTVTASAPLDNTAGNLTLAYDPTTLKVEGGVLKGTDTSSISNRINAVNDSITALHQRIDTTAGGSTELDNVLFAGTGSPESPYAPKTFTVGSIGELKTYNGQFKYYAVVEGQISAGDFGKRSFRWDASSTATPDDVTIVQVPGVTTGRWIHIPLDNTYNVAWWGLNTTDIGALLNTVISAVPAGSIVKIPQQNGKIFTLATTINLNKPIDIDFGNARFERNGTTGNYVSVSSKNVTIRNGWLRGQPTDTTYTGGQINNFVSVVGTNAATPITNFNAYNIRTSMGKNSSFWLRYVDTFNIVDCRSDTMPYSGIMALTVRDGKIQRFIGNQFRGVFVYSGTAPNIDTSINAYGIAISKGSTVGDHNSSRVIVEDCQLDYNPWWEMIDTHGSDNLIIRNNTIKRANKGIALVYYYFGGIGDAPRNFMITGNTIDNSALTYAECGIQIQGYTDFEYGDGLIQGNTVRGSNIELANTRGVKVHANTIYHPSRGAGLHLKNNTFSTDVNGLLVYDVWNSDGTGNNAAVKLYTTKNFATLRGVKLLRGDFTPPAGFETYLNRYGIRPNNDDITNRIVVDMSTCDFSAGFFRYANTKSLVFVNNPTRRRVTSNYVVVAEDYEIGYESATGGHTITVPAPDSLYHYRRIVISNSSTFTLGITPSFYTVFGGAAQSSIPARSSVELTLDSAYNIIFGRLFQMDPPPAGGGGDSSTYVTHTRIKAVIDSNNNANKVQLSPAYFADSSGWAIQIATLPDPTGQANGLIPKIVSGRWQLGTDETGSGGTGITGLNGQTGSTQTFAVPSLTGTAPAWSSASNIHTLSIPLMGSGVTAGLLSNTTQSIYGTKNMEGVTTGQFAASSTSPDNANLGVYTSGGSQQTSANFKMGGSTQNVYIRTVSRGSSSTGLAANTSYSGFSIGLMTVLEPASGHSDYITGMSIQAPNITAGAASLGFSAALTLGVNTAPVTTLGNWSLYAYGPGRFSALTAANLGSGVAITSAAGAITSETALDESRGGTGATTGAQGLVNLAGGAGTPGQVLMSNGTSYGPATLVDQTEVKSATTTSTTPTTLFTYTPAAGTAGVIEIVWVAQNNNGSTTINHFIRKALYPYSRTQAGVTTSHLTDVLSEMKTSGYTPSPTVTVIGDALTFQIASSAAAETCNWVVYVKYFKGDISQ